MSEINSILNILSDGKIHDIEELKLKSMISDFEITQILEFLNIFDFIEIVDYKKVKTKKIFRKIIRETNI